MISPYAEFHFETFAVQSQQLLTRLLVLLQQDPVAFPAHLEAEFFKKLRTRMNMALVNPEASEYGLGNTLTKQNYGGKSLGAGYSNWRRIKNGMPDRYRLFFQFSSKARELIFAWLNDQRSIRRESHKNDVYAVFAKLLGSDAIPTDYKALREKSFPHVSALAKRQAPDIPG